MIPLYQPSKGEEGCWEPSSGGPLGLLPAAPGPVPCRAALALGRPLGAGGGASGCLWLRGSWKPGYVVGVWHPLVCAGVFPSPVFVSCDHSVLFPCASLRPKWETVVAIGGGWGRAVQVLGGSLASRSWGRGPQAAREKPRCAEALCSPRRDLHFHRDRFITLTRPQTQAGFSSLSPPLFLVYELMDLTELRGPWERKMEGPRAPPRGSYQEYRG